MAPTANRETSEHRRLASGEVLRSADTAARGYRWLHLELHRPDVVRGFDSGAGWAAAMTALLLLQAPGRHGLMARRPARAP